MTARTMDGDEINVGDTVCFKSDVEQWGRVTKISRSSFGGLYTLTLEKEHGFEGDYIGGQTVTTEMAENCWK